MKRIARISVFYMLMLSSTSGFAQYANTPFIQDFPHDSSRLKSIYLSFETLSFLKNNEYISYIADGYTLFGFQALPYFSYFPFKNVRVNAGAYLQKDFGNNKFSTIEPYFSVKVSHKNFHIVFGNLEGGLNHRLIEPLYDFERALIDRQEFGLQFLFTRPGFFVDVWSDWNNMIYKGDPEQELINGGLSIEKTFQLGSLQIGTLAQLVVFHRGGQIDASPEYLLTRTNITGGLDLKLQLGNLIESINGSAFYVHSTNGERKMSKAEFIPNPNPFAVPQYPEASKGDTLVYGSGKAFYGNLGIQFKHNIQLMGSFWIADNFASPIGGQLYPSESSSYKKAGLVVTRRTLIIARVFHDWKISDNTTFSTRVEPYWDLNTNLFEFSFGFYLNFKPDFFIWREK